MNTQAKLEIEESKFREANVILCKIDKSRRMLKKHIKRLHNEKKMFAEEN